MKKKAVAVILLDVTAEFDDDEENDLEDQAITALDDRASEEFGLMSYQYELHNIEVMDVSNQGMQADGAARDVSPTSNVDPESSSASAPPLMPGR